MSTKLARQALDIVLNSTSSKNADRSHKKTSAPAGKVAKSKYKYTKRFNHNPLDVLRKQAKKEEDIFAKNVEYFSKGLKASKLEIELHKRIFQKHDQSKKTPENMQNEENEDS